MTPRAEEFLRLMREYLQRAVECERVGNHSAAWTHGTTAARWLASAIRLDA